MKIKLLYTFIFIGLFAIACEKKADQKIHYVNDNANVLTDVQQSKLTEKIKALEQSIGSQIVILTIESLAGEKIEDYSIRTAAAWAIGRKDYDDGILITVSVQDKQMRIEVGYGLEKIITDEIAAQIIRDDMAPDFQAGNYYEGFHLAVEKIIKLITDNKHLVGQR